MQILAARQLTYMFTNYDKIINLLTKVSGTTMSTSGIFWSSTVYSAVLAWCVYFGNGYLNGNSATFTYQVRLVKDL